MIPNKAYVNELYGEFYHNNQAICISFYVKNIMLVTDIVNAIKRRFDICKAFPFTLFDYGSPFL